MNIKDEFDKPKELEALVKQEGKAPHPLVLSIDYEKYEHYLEDSNLTEAQKQEFLQALWNIIVNFVDLGFGVHPVQQAIAASCGKEQEILAKDRLSAKNKVILTDKALYNNFDIAVDPKKAPPQKGLSYDE